jgi:hypothetical protein
MTDSDYKNHNTLQVAVNTFGYDKLDAICKLFKKHKQPEFKAWKAIQTARILPRFRFFLNNHQKDKHQNST